MIMDLNKVATNAYEKAARKHDSGQSSTPPKLATNRAVQDAVMSARHCRFDLQAKDNTPKYCRPHFAVVGEGSQRAQAAFRQNYDLIDWGS